MQAILYLGLLIAAMLALKFLFVIPLVTVFGLTAALLFIGACYLIAVRLDRGDRQKRHEAEQQALRERAESLHKEIEESLARPQRDDGIIDAEFTVISEQGAGRKPS